MSETQPAAKPRKPTLTREAMYQLIRSPVVTEKVHRDLSEHNQVMFRVATACHQAADQGSGRGPVRCEGYVREHAGAEGQDQAVQGPARQAIGRQEGVRATGRGPVDRSLQRPRIGRGQTMALRQFNPVTASLRGTVLIDRCELWKGKPVKALTVGKSHSRRTQQPRPHPGAVSRRRAQAVVPQRRLQASQVRRAGDRGAAGIRPEPQRVHRPGEIPGRRVGLHHRAAAAEAPATR